jgi:UDP-N-acetylglucosamine acyltransferase
MPAIHPTAQVSSEARIAPDVEIGPYCIIGPNVSLAEGCRLSAHVSIAGHTSVGPRARIAPFASLGTPPQSIRYRGGPTRLVIGADCDIREGVTMNTGTEDDRGVTDVGDRCFFMATSHVGHDCQVGNDVTFANGVVLGGHVRVGNNVFFGGKSAVHQFVRIGNGVMVGGLSGIGRDVIPYGLALGQIADLRGLNVVGMRRQKLSRADILRVRRAFRQLFHGPGQFADRVDAVERDYSSDPLVGQIVAFLRERGRRPLMGPARRGAEAADDADA